MIPICFGIGSQATCRSYPYSISGIVMITDRPSKMTQSTTGDDALLERLEQLQASIGSVDDTAMDRDNQQQLVSVVIPVFNELATAAQVIRRVRRLPLNLEVIVVDDASTDGTSEVLSQLQAAGEIVLIQKNKNEGKGAGLRDGFARATGEFILVQDADLEYNPEDIPKLLEPLFADQADVVFGSRYIGVEQRDTSWVHRLGNWVLTEASNLFTGIRLTDMETCYKAFRKEVLKDLNIRQNRFGVEPEMTAKIARRGYRIVEIPISYQARGYEDGKKIGVRDLFKTVYCIVRYGISD